MAWSTPKTNWTSTDGIAYGDLNRIEANTVDLDSRLDTLESSNTLHVADTDIHATKETVRTASALPLRLQLTTSDSAHTSGDIWFRTDL